MNTKKLVIYVYELQWEILVKERKGQEVAWRKGISVALSFDVVAIMMPLIYTAIRRCSVRQ